MAGAGIGSGGKSGIFSQDAARPYNNNWEIECINLRKGVTQLNFFGGIKS
jgi:hypothetical protein